MSRVTLIHHVNLQISNRQRTIDWYEKVLGAEFLDRGPTLNKVQLQFRLGNAEVHTNEPAVVVQTPVVHFAVEVADWDETIENLKTLGVPYHHDPRSSAMDERASTWEHREYTGHHYTYVRDPDGNIIELMYHPLGLEDSAGKKVNVVHDPDSLTWTKRPEYDTSK
jgi:catechol 2,3-dioxygenase-like lactoylglutathione lyase family enzyme